MLDSLSPVAPAPGAGAGRATPSQAGDSGTSVFEWQRVKSSYRNRMEPSLKSS